MKRITGISLKNGNVEILDTDVDKCLCVKDIDFKEPVYLSSNFGSCTPPPINKRTYIKGDMYDFSLDQRTDITNPYMVFIDNNQNSNEYTYFTKEEFDEHFVTIEQHRQDQIDKIL